MSASAKEVSKKDRDNILTSFLGFVLNLKPEQLSPKTVDDIYKVVSCILYIRDNQNSIKEKVNHKHLAATYANPTDQKNGVLRDSDGTSFHIAIYDDGKHFIESFSLYIQEIETAIKLMTERGEEILIQFASKFSYDKNVGCLEARTAPAIAFCQRQLSTTFDLTDKIEATLQALEQEGSSTESTTTRLLIKLSDLTGKHCIIRIENDSIYHIFSPEVLKKYLIDYLAYDEEDFPESFKIAADNISTAQESSSNPSALARDANIASIQSHCESSFKKNKVKITIGQLGMVKVFFHAREPATEIIRLLKQHSVLISLGIEKCRLSTGESKDGKKYYLFRLTFDQYQFVFDAEATHRLLEKRTILFGAALPKPKPINSEPPEIGLFTQLRSIFNRERTLFDLARDNTDALIKQIEGAAPDQLERWLTERNLIGETVLHLSAKCQSKEFFLQVIHLIHHKNPALLSKCLMMRNSQNESLLDCVLSYQSGEAVLALLKNLSIPQLKKIFSFSSQESGASTLLHRLASNKECGDMVFYYLLQLHEFDFNDLPLLAVVHNNENFLSIAISNNLEDVVAIMDRLNGENLYQLFTQSQCSTLKLIFDKYGLKEDVLSRLGKPQLDAFIKAKSTDTNGNIHDLLFNCIITERFDLFIYVSKIASAHLGYKHLFSSQKINSVFKDICADILLEKILALDPIDYALNIIEYLDSTALYCIIHAAKSQPEIDRVRRLISIAVKENKISKESLLRLLNTEQLEADDYIIYTHIALGANTLDSLNYAKIEGLRAYVFSFLYSMFYTISDEESLSKMKEAAQLGILDGLMLIRNTFYETLFYKLALVNGYETTFKYLVETVHPEALALILPQETRGNSFLTALMNKDEQSLIVLIKRLPSDVLPYFLNKRITYANENETALQFLLENKKDALIHVVMDKMCECVHKWAELPIRVRENSMIVLHKVMKYILDHKKIAEYLSWLNNDAMNEFLLYAKKFNKPTSFFFHIADTQPDYIVQKLIDAASADTLCALLNSDPDILIPLGSNQSHATFMAFKQKIDSKSPGLFIRTLALSPDLLGTFSLYCTEEIFTLLIREMIQHRLQKKISEWYGFVRTVLLYHSAYCIQSILSVASEELLLSFISSAHSPSFRGNLRIQEKLNMALCMLMCDSHLSDKAMAAILSEEKIDLAKKTPYVSLLTLKEDPYFFAVIHQLLENNMLPYILKEIIDEFQKSGNKEKLFGFLGKFKLTIFNSFERSLLLSIIARIEPNYFLGKDEEIHRQVLYYQPRPASHFLTQHNTLLPIDSPTLESELIRYGTAQPVDKWLLQSSQQRNFSFPVTTQLLKMRREQSEKTVQSTPLSFFTSSSEKEFSANGHKSILSTHEEAAFQGMDNLIRHQNCLIKVIKPEDWDPYIAQLRDTSDRSHKIRLETTGTHKYKHMSDTIVPYPEPKSNQPKNTIKKNSTTLVSYDDRNNLWPHVFGSHDDSRPLVGLLFDKTKCTIKAQLSSDYGTYPKPWVGSENAVKSYREEVQAHNFVAGNETGFWQKVSGRRRYNEVLAETSNEAIVGIVICREHEDDYRSALTIQARLSAELGVEVPIFIYEAGAQLRLYPEAFAILDSEFGLHHDSQAETSAYAILQAFKERWQYSTNLPPNSIMERALHLIAATENLPPEQNTPGLWLDTLAKIRKILAEEDNLSGYRTHGACARASMQLGY